MIWSSKKGLNDAYLWITVEEKRKTVGCREIAIVAAKYQINHIDKLEDQVGIIVKKYITRMKKGQRKSTQ